MHGILTENRLTYSITNGNTGNAFEVVADLGEIKVRRQLDYESGPRVSLLYFNDIVNISIIQLLYK